MKKVTILDIAKELNITFSSVARALNDHPGISAATKKAVRETADRLGYRQNKIASSLRSGRTNTIGVIVPSLKVSFFSSVVSGIEEIMNNNGYNILLYQSHESQTQENRGITTFLNSRVDGIIASISTDTENGEAFEDVVNRKTPLVFFDRSIESIDVPSVTIDDYQGGFIATEHLIRQGYKRIMHITSSKNIGIFSERLRGYLDALKHYNIEADEQLIVKGDFSRNFGREVISRFYSEKVPFDAVFALEDYTAMGVLEQLRELNIQVPGEIGVIGFANEAFGNLVTPQLSTIDQQTLTMGKEVARIFLNLLKNDQSASKQPERIVLEPVLIQRASSLRHREN